MEFYLRWGDRRRRVVGIVYMASEHYSVVISVLNSKSNISCKIKNSDYFGYLKWGAW